MLLLAPTDTTAQPWFRERAGLVDLAGVLVAATALGSAGTAVVSPDVTLAAQGVQDGFRTSQRDDGGQWDHDFRDPIVKVQAVGTTAPRARAELETTVDRVVQELRSRESASGVAPESDVRTSVLPALPVVLARRGSPARAVLGVVVLGGAATALAMRALRSRQA